MATLLTIVIVFVYLAIIWVAVIALYNMFLEPFDFGPLGSFAVKSLVLVLTVALFVSFFPWLGRFGSVIVWWIGLMVIFKKDFWECKILVIMIWGISFLGILGISALLALMAPPNI